MTDLWKIEVSLVYVASSRPAGDTGRPCQTKTKNYNQKKKKGGEKNKGTYIVQSCSTEPKRLVACWDKISSI